MNKQEKIIIEDIAYGGSGVGKLEDGRVCFVPFTAIGDELIVEIKNEKKNFVEAAIVNINKSSKDRVKPECEYFTICGGCHYQHIDYKQQLNIKHNQFKNVIQRIGTVKLPKINIISSSKIYAYRNKLRLSPYSNNEGKIIYGLYKHQSRKILDIKKCLLVGDEINQKISVVNQQLLDKKKKDYKKISKVTIRKSSEDDAVIYYGKVSSNYPWLKEKVLGDILYTPLKSFFQINLPIAEKLLEEITLYLNKLPVKNVIDAFCGVGFLSLASNKKVFGIEQDKLAIVAAKKNAKNKDIKATYFVGNVVKFLHKQISRCGSQNSVVILDPPRGGCSRKILDILEKQKPIYIIYVSCDCSTLGRDLKSLSKYYKVKKANLFDMFPQTAHFETMLLLEKM